MERIKTCGDCVHADLCEKDVTLPEFSRRNAAHCEGFRSAENFVEVVRCKDCKHWWKIAELCTHEKCCEGVVAVVSAPPTHFCGYGERKGNSGAKKDGGADNG